MFPEELTLTTSEKTTLSRIKGRTGLQSWRVLCRWAISLSLSEPTTLRPPSGDAASNVHLDWGELLGLEAPLYRVAMLYRLSLQSAPLTEEALFTYLRLHLARGITYLGSCGKIRQLSDLIQFALTEQLGGLEDTPWSARDEAQGAVGAISVPPRGAQ